MAVLAHAAFFVLRALAVQNHNGRVGLEAVVRGSMPKGRLWADTHPPKNAPLT